LPCFFRYSHICFRLDAHLDPPHFLRDPFYAILHNSPTVSFYTIQASDAQTKLIPVIRVGGRTQAVAYGVVHELKHRLRAGCIPVFSTDGLKPYSYAFIERINLTLRQDVSELARRSWGLAQFTPELVDHTEWWRAYYHFVHYNNSLKVELTIPIPGKGKQQPSRYRRRTPARQLA
jgi:hypothetical protein